jgi:hypothetical protein
MRPSRVATPIVGCLAALGVLAGHWLAYALVHPDAHARRAALAAAHGWLPTAQEIVPLAAIAAAAAIVRDRAIRRHGEMPTRGQLARDLAAIQVGAFCTLEVAERLAGGPWSDLPGVLAVGVIAQIALAVALAGAMLRLIRLGIRAGAALARAAALPRPGSAPVSVGAIRLGIPPAGRPARIRAPPAAG